MTAKQADYLQPVNPAPLTNYFNENINTLISDTETKVYPSSDDFWFPTPENCPNPDQLEGVQRRIYDEIVKLKQQEKVDPLNCAEDRKNFLAQFPWTNSVFNLEQRKTV